MKKILLGISGGIAAYKSPQIVRRLIERGAEVRVVMTEGAKEFITPLTLQAVSGNEVRHGLWDESAEAAMGHIELARWADEILIAPATASVIARLAHGHADDLLSTLCLATDAPITLAPAMNRLMWSNPATIDNVNVLRGRGVKLLGPTEGEQACGETGLGRMLEPLEIVDAFLVPAKRLYAGEKVVISAGPTREPLDPVRYITNRSSGRMGYALAEAFRDAGAEVCLVSGPVTISPPAGVRVVSIETAIEMRDAVMAELTGTRIFIGAAAIADYSPAKFSGKKIKKADVKMQLDMVKAPDTLATVAASRKPPFTVGFAAETNNVKEYALKKLAKKKLDMIIANQVGEGLGFDCCDNTVCVLWNDGEKSFPCMNKRELAVDLAELVAEHYYAARNVVSPIKETVA